jgi:hypothetical protein
MKNIKNNIVAMSFLCYWLQYLPDGGIQWLLVKLWTSSIGQYARIVPAHRHGHQNGQL